jgi:hypothetical protein
VLAEAQTSHHVLQRIKNLAPMRVTFCIQPPCLCEVYRYMLV